MTDPLLTTPIPDAVEPSCPDVLAGEVVGHGLFRLAPADLSAARKRPGPVPSGWTRVPANLLRYADEQTVASVAAVFQAIEALGSSPDRFEAWGVIVASRYLGRANLAQVLRNFAAEGVWGVSPHLIPHFALHSPSGTISLALGSHGPNLGLGGGRHSPAEGFLAAFTWLSDGSVPGVWLVLAGWSPELVPARPGEPAPGGECRAIALALAAPAAGTDRPRFRLSFGTGGPRPPEPLDPADLAGWLEGREPFARRIVASDPSGRTCVTLESGLSDPGGA